MIITKRLITEANGEVNAVLINDEGEEYPVFLETLHNTIIFPTLMDSGYTLTSLPYGFVSSTGVKFDSLPVEEYKPSHSELETMYNSIGVKLDYNEIKSHLVVNESSGLAMPDTNYRIKTREEFLKYLETSSKVNLDDDFMPLNFFVAPEARFSIEEYTSTNNLEYINIISNRREMSLSKFRKLVSWLESMGLLADSSPHSVLDAYFAWGVDGLNFTPIARRRESSALRLRANKNIVAKIQKKTQGLVDGAGNLLIPKNERNVMWKLQCNDPDYIQALTSGMSTNDTVVQEFYVDSFQDITTLEGNKYNVQYSLDCLVLASRTYPSIRIKSPVEPGTMMDISLAMPSQEEELFKFCFLKALASMLYDKRYSRVKTSSYDALTIVGANPLNALNYVTTYYDMDKERKGQNGEDCLKAGYFDIVDYLEGRDVSTDVKQLFDDIIEGRFCIDNIGQAKSAEASMSAQSMFNELYAVHHVLEIPLKEIYEKIVAVSENDKFVLFSSGELQYKLDVSPIKLTMNGYIRDVQNYDLQAAEQCNFFTYVTLVAREVGVETCRRHVAAEFLTVNKAKSKVKEIVKWISDKYEDKVNTTLVDAAARAKALKMTNVFALSRFFEIALKGTLTWSKQLGSTVEYVDKEIQQAAVSNTEVKIESLPVYCDFTVTCNSSTSLNFNAYCTNAYITPTYVIPRGQSPIKEIPFYTAWMELDRTNPDVYAKLVEMGVLTPGFVPWSYRYLTQQFKQRDIMSSDGLDSLFYYYTNAAKEVKEFPNNIEFTAVTHPVEYLFPGLFEEEDDKVEQFLKVPREGAPVIRFGSSREITIEDYRDILYPSEFITEPDQYIKELSNISAEAFMLLGKEALNKMPSDSKEMPVVLKSSGNIYIPSKNEFIDFTRVTELNPDMYAVENIYGRVWLLRSADGKLWEVKV